MWVAAEVAYEAQIWRFDVEGTPAQRRRVCQMVDDRTYVPLMSTEAFRVSPKDSCVRLAGREFRFRCSYQGEELTVNGREAEGEERETLLPKLKREQDSGGFSVVTGVLAFPREGVWRMFYWIGEEMVARQTVMTGAVEQLKLTKAETTALKAKLPQD
jgi:hypothetical protein